MNGEADVNDARPAPTDGGRRLQWMVAAAAAVIGGVSGCGGGGGAPRDPIEISGSSVTLSNGTVQTECFTFRLPTEIEYEMKPDSESCQTAIRRAGGDSFSEIMVFAQVGENDLESFFDASRDSFASDGGVPVTTETTTIAGVRAGVARGGSEYGLAYTFYFLPDATGTFLFEGEPITSFLIVGPSGVPELEDALEKVVASFRFKT